MSESLKGGQGNAEIFLERAHLSKALALALCFLISGVGVGMNLQIFPELKVLSPGKHWPLLKSFFQQILWPCLPFIRFSAPGLLYVLPSFLLPIIMFSMSSFPILDCKLLGVRDCAVFAFNTPLESLDTLCLAYPPSLPVI